MTQPGFLQRPSVLASSEFLRVNALPRRVWDFDGPEAATLAEQMTALLRTPQGTMSLKPVQAVALFEAWRARGLFGALGVGAGKTLLFFLLPTVLESQRPVLILPAKLADEKTKKEWAQYAAHWRIPAPHLVSYELLARVQSKTLLQDLNPDLVMCDEAHKLKNTHAAVTRRVKAWRKANPTVPLCIGSGSVTKRSIRDYAHLLAWTLGLGSPLPLRDDDLENWAFALDGGTTFANRLEPGALLAWAEGEDLTDETAAARRGFQRRLAQTPGVVVYHVPQDNIGAEIEITAQVLMPPPEMTQAWEALRDRWELPDGTELVEGCEVYRHARELAKGFYYKWRRPGPDPWMQARKTYGQFTREKLKTGRWDSPDEVAKAFPNAAEVTEWQAIRNTFEPETCIVWLSTHALQVCADWLKGGGVCFVEHVLFAQALAFLAKVPFFGRGGLDANGASIEHFKGKACIASLGSNTEGRNLQHFSRMLVVNPVPNGLQLEQLLGREHREGQEADTVEVTILFGCYEDAAAFWASVNDAKTDTVHNNHKVLMSKIQASEMWELPQEKAFQK